MNNKKILFAASEAVPFAKTGGLADVAGSLPKVLSKLGQDVRAVMPKYSVIPKEYVEKMEYLGYIYVNVGWRHQFCGILKLEHNGSIVYFIDNEFYFKRDNLYGYLDEAERYAFFCIAVLDMLPLIDFKPDIIHCNDWQTGIISMLIKSKYSHLPLYQNVKTVFTIHNLKYQGVFPGEVLGDLLGLGSEYFNPDGIEFHGCVNYLKAGLVYSDIITTVSNTYAEEIKSDYFGENLNGVLIKRADRLFGILNGIDFDENNPATDKRLFTNFDSNNLSGKYINKSRLQESLGLPQKSGVPVIGIISRLVDQKGFDLISYVLDRLLTLDLQVIVLGSGDGCYEDMFRQAASKYPDKLSASIKYDGILAQRIYAGSDMFLMPSLFEPCGLSQLFSLRYGTIPIVRETGGLNDTIRSYNEFTGEGNGFSFTNYNAEDMLFTIKRAISFYHRKDVWHELVTRAMHEDFSWDKSAREYIDLYER